MSEVWKKATGRYRWTRRGGQSAKIKPAHVALVEQILGRPLLAGAEVHHVDFNRANNANTNLVVCPDRAYHRLLHQRTAAYDACGHADWRHCVYCKIYSPLSDLKPIGNGYYHLACHSAHCRAYRKRKVA